MSFISLFNYFRRNKEETMLKELEYQEIVNQELKMKMDSLQKEKDRLFNLVQKMMTQK